ncbi:hydantoinase/oxoprolinase family protein [Bacillus sp. Marseille-P3661]|uniref:hydantoinase/oxoprolinase family protein n=1 Tax=Bacillus sp. Marseille-P3661 TaxID=1936234 RepID=UPI000C867231|nr:hydantoinase/oxoprolinase family protein [Bacillus sp. Marseille-P3661]
MNQYLISTDTGGTFVDIVISDNEGNFFFAKAPSNPKNPPEGILAGIESAAEQLGETVPSILSKTKMVFNGTTVTTNAMLELKGARTGLLTTKGFEDTLSIARVLGRTAGFDESQLLDYRHADPPVQIVPRKWVRGLNERIDAYGNEVVSLSLEEAEQAVDELVKEGVEAIAICLLWSFRNSIHEEKVKELIEQKYPDIYVVASSDLVPIIREFERSNTTAINAYLGPIFHNYADSLQKRLIEENHLKEPLVMQSIGGLATAEEIKKVPITTLLSGPVGGVIASQKLGQLLGEENLITTDMGGTSFDVGLILNGQPVTTPVTVMARQFVAIPTVDIVTVGAGGGSVAWLNEVGTLHVGPESMGAYPGPACYMRGGTLPTVTDADVVLGYIDPDYFLGGKMNISRDKAVTAIKRHIADPMGISVEEAASAIYQIVNARMADLIRNTTVERGNDPRDFSMLAFGGCGPTHCTGYGPDIGVRRMIIPQAATVFSAFGIGQSDIRHSYVQSYPKILRDRYGEVDTSIVPEVQTILNQLTSRAKEQISRDKLNEEGVLLIYSVDLRYRNQIHELVVPLKFSENLKNTDLKQLIIDFQVSYEKQYGHGASSPNSAIELLNLRLDIVAATENQLEIRPLPLEGTDGIQAYLEDKPMYQIDSKSFRDVPVYKAENFKPGNTVVGPALIVSYGTTIPLHNGQQMEMDRYQNLIITVDSIG